MSIWFPHVQIIYVSWGCPAAWNLKHIDYMSIWFPHVPTIYVSWGDMADWILNHIDYISICSLMYRHFMCLEAALLTEIWTTLIAWVFDSLMYRQFMCLEVTQQTEFWITLIACCMSIFSLMYRQFMCLEVTQQAEFWITLIARCMSIFSLMYRQSCVLRWPSRLNSKQTADMGIWLPHVTDQIINATTRPTVAPCKLYSYSLVVCNFLSRPI